MLIKVQDLGSEIKSSIRAAIKECLIKALHTLPLASEEGKIKECITPEVCASLDSIVIDYYRRELDVEIDCRISAEDYVKIYLNRI